MSGKGFPGFLLGALMGAVAVFVGALASFAKAVEYIHLYSLNHVAQHSHLIQKGAEWEALCSMAAGVTVFVFGTWLLFCLLAAYGAKKDKEDSVDKP